MNSSLMIQLIISIVLVLLSAFFSSAETAVTMVNKIRIRTLCEDGNRRARILQKVLDRYPKVLSAILIGNNIVNIAASALVTTFTMEAFGSVYIGVATGILTLAVLMFGEIIPKNIAAIHCEGMALTYAPIIYGMTMLLLPIIFVVELIAKVFLILFRADKTKAETITESELRSYVDVGSETGVIEEEEKDIINNLFDFSDAVAEEIMIPAIEMVTVPYDIRYGELIAIAREHMYTRFPVYDGEKEHIVGMVNVKDLLGVKNTRSFRVKEVLRSVYYTYEKKKTADLLNEMRGNGLGLTIVIDEYGNAVGMITLEDLLEEIVGEIRDEYDADEKDKINQISEREYIVAGSMKLDDLNDAIDSHFESEDFDSIGGVLIGLLDKLPEEGDCARMEDGTALFAEKVVKNRIIKVRIVFCVDEVLPEDETEKS